MGMMESRYKAEQICLASKPSVTCGMCFKSSGVFHDGCLSVTLSQTAFWNTWRCAGVGWDEWRRRTRTHTTGTGTALYQCASACAPSRSPTGQSSLHTDRKHGASRLSHNQTQKHMHQARFCEAANFNQHQALHLSTSEMQQSASTRRQHTAYFSPAT